MKPLFKYIIAFVLVIGVLAPPAALEAEAAKKPITVILDGKKINFDIQPVMKNYRVMVPYRALLEAMGAKVYWNKASGTIRSTKGDETVQLTLYSKTAYVNGEAVALDSPPIIKKGRTLVPLRFLSESLKGSVKWNSAKQQVTIIIDGEQPVKSKAQIYVNNNRLNLSPAPLTIDNRTFIPYESFINGMDEQTVWSRDGNEIFTELQGISIWSFVGQEYAVVNGEVIYTNGAPMERDGIIYVPVHYLRDVLKGSYHTQNNNIYFSILSADFRRDMLLTESGSIATPKNVTSATLVGERRLMISDNPENLTHQVLPTENETLWEDNVELEKDAVEHRVHGWHLNNLGKRVQLGITIENRSATNRLRIEGLEGIIRKSSSGWGNYNVGLPMAKAVLNQTLSPIRMVNPTIGPKETKVIQFMELNHKELIGFLSDFTVKNAAGTEGLDYIVRVVVSQNNGNLAQIQTPAISKNVLESHPRGTWSASELQTELPPYYAGGREYAYSISNGKTDDLMTPETSFGDKEGAVRNPGHYGAVYKVTIPLINDRNETKTVRVRLSARGGSYNGAVKVLDQVYLVPHIQPFIEVANVVDYELKPGKDTLELEIMHSGGASLPLAIDLITID